MKGFFKNGCPAIKLFVENEKIDVEIDTGFNDYLMLSHTLIGKLALVFEGIHDYVAANGKKTLTIVYKGKVKLLGVEKEVRILSTDADFCLAGMELFNDCKIVIEKSKNFVEITKTK